MKKKMSILFLLAVALSLVSSTATADTATFLERETYNLDGWFDYWRYHDFDGTTYAQYADSRSNDPSEWRAKTGAALAFAVLFRRTNNNAAAFEAQELLWRVYWSTYESGSPGERLKPEHGTCDAFDRGARAQALLDWLVAYMLLHTNDESPYTPYLWNPVPEWDEVLINLADK